MKTTAMLAVLTALLLTAPGTGQADDDPRVVTSTFEETDVLAAIRQVAEAGGLNVIVSPDVRGTVSVRLQGVPVKDALRQIAEAVGARVVEEDGGILRVVPANRWREASMQEARARYRLDELRRMRAQRAEAASAEEIARTEARLAEVQAQADRLRAEMVEVERQADRVARERLEVARRLADGFAARDERKHDERERGSSRERAAHLERAAESLRAAGMHAEATRAWARARQLRQAADETDAGADVDLVASVNALRGDVRALREQVAELTELVRRFLAGRQPAGKRR